MKKLLALFALICLCALSAPALGDAIVTEGVLIFNDAEAACYTSADLGGTVKQMRAKARFYGGGACALIATPNYPDTVDAITGRSIHVVFDAHGYFLGFYENGALKDVKTGEYTLDLTGEKTYSFGWSVSGRTITLTLPTGKTVKYTGDQVKACGGQYAVWEHYMTGDDLLAGTGPAYTGIRGVGQTSLRDDFKTDGELTNAPTGQEYILFSN